MKLVPFLNIERGITAVIGGGGKTTLLETLAGELREQGTVILCTSTQIWPPSRFETLTETGAEEICAAAKKNGILCVGTMLAQGKLTAPKQSFKELAALADFVLVEADGAKHRPLKAHAPYEPVIPPERTQVIYVVGADGFGHPISEVCHRPERYSALCGVPEGAAVTPELAARVIRAEGHGDRIYMNKAEHSEDYKNAEQLAKLLSLPCDGGQSAQGGIQMLTLIRGAGDLASGIALRLWRSGIDVVMTDISRPTAIRRTVAFSEAVVRGKTVVEDVTAQRAETAEEARALLENGIIPVFEDPKAQCRETLAPDVVVDAILAKRNLGTKITDAPVVIGVGPGFTAGEDCHAVIETMRGHTLGRVIYRGSALPNTNIPGLIGGFSGERVLRAPADGVFRGVHEIGDHVELGEIIGYVGETPMYSTLTGVLRGVLADGTQVKTGMKSGDVDPRGEVTYCQSASDKSLAIGGGVLEAILHLGGALGRRQKRDGNEEG